MMSRNAAEVAREAARGLMFIFKRVDSLVERCAWCLLSTERGLMLIFDRIDAYLEDEPSPPTHPDEWDPAGAKPPPVQLPDGMDWWKLYVNYWVVEEIEQGSVGFVFLAADEQSWCARIRDGVEARYPSALEACQAIATQLATPPKSDEWDPAGDAPPPVALPEGMRWRREDGTYGYPDWDVWDIVQDRFSGYVTPTSDGWTANVNFKAFYRGTALEACQELAKELAKERDHE